MHQLEVQYLVKCLSHLAWLGLCNTVADCAKILRGIVEFPDLEMLVLAAAPIVKARNSALAM